MRRHYVGVIVGVFETLQHGCCGHPLGEGRTGLWMFLLGQGISSFDFPGPGVYQVGGSGVIVEESGDCSPSSYGG